jgi:hypothetical protein
MNPELVGILLVEDDPGDVVLIRESFQDHKVANELTVVSDGESRRWPSCAARESTPPPAGPGSCCST